MAGLTLDYSAPGDTLWAFRRSPAMARALFGPIMGGRKTCASYDIMLRAVQGSQRQWRWVVLAANEAALDEAVIPAWHRVVPRELGDWDAQKLRHNFEPFYKNRAIRIDIRFLARERIAKGKLGTTIGEVSGIWLSGARDLDEDTFDAALAAVGSWPLDEPPQPLVICTSRMPSADHWLARRPELTRFHQPGGRTARAENLKHLKPGFYTRLAAGRPADWVRTNIDAEFGINASDIAESRRLREDVMGRFERLAEGLRERSAELAEVPEEAQAA